MELRFSPLFSGSSGNCTYVGCDEGALLIDAGVSGKRILQALDDIGAPASSINGILVTHEHSDHITAVGILSRKLDIPVYATEGTWNAMPGKIGDIAAKNRVIIQPETGFFLGGMEVIPFSTPHDAAESVGFTVSLGRSSFTLATDIGCVKDGWMQHALESDAVLLESNYDPGMLNASSYPFELKRRIIGRRGHLSNDDCAEAALRLVNGGIRHLILGHLSKENNYPELARQVTEMTLTAAGVRLDEDVRVCVAERDRVTGLYGITADIIQRRK